MPQQKTAPWRFLAVTATLALANLVQPAGLGRDLGHAAVAAVAVAAVLVGVRAHRPEMPGGWYLMTAGLASWVLNGVVAGPAGDRQEFPSPTLGVFLLGAVLIAAGAILLATGRRDHRDPTAAIDSLVMTTGVGYWVWLVAVERPAGGREILTELLAAAHPSAVILVLVSMTYLCASRRTISPSPVLLISAVLLLVVGGTLGGSGPNAGLPLAPDVSATAHLLGFGLWGAAALHPSMTVISRRRGGAERSTETQRILALAAAVALVPAAIAVQVYRGQAVAGAMLVLTFGVIIVLVLVRMLWMVSRLRDQAARLTALADTDFVTGLENRRRFTERLTSTLALGGIHPGGASVMLVAIERLAEINETLGLRAGDELLHGVGQRLSTQVARDGVVARIGGDTFGIVLAGGTSARDVEDRAEGIRAACAEPLVLSGMTVSVGAAIGIASGTCAGGDAHALLLQADLALAVARESTDRIATYAVSMEAGGALTASLMTELRAAIDDDAVVVHFQPQVDLLTGRVLGVEALVRWQHPRHGLLGPATFVPGAERTGLIRPLTLHVLDRTLAQSARWQAAGRNLSVSVNLSVRNLLDPGFVSDVRRSLERHGVSPGSLELEITETMAMVDPIRSVAVLHALSDLGVLLSVDDYGTGYSSLSYLQQLPVGRLKIDRSFVAGVIGDPGSAAIVRSTIELARLLGLTVVAEGVEDDETYLTLRAMRCESAQGFGLGRPVAADDIPALIAAIEGRLPGVVRPRVPAQRGA